MDTGIGPLTLLELTEREPDAARQGADGPDFAGSWEVARPLRDYAPQMGAGAARRPVPTSSRLVAAHPRGFAALAAGLLAWAALTLLQPSLPLLSRCGLAAMAAAVLLCGQAMAAARAKAARPG